MFTFPLGDSNKQRKPLNVRHVVLLLRFTFSPWNSCLITRRKRDKVNTAARKYCKKTRGMLTLGEIQVSNVDRCKNLQRCESYVNREATGKKTKQSNKKMIKCCSLKNPSALKADPDPVSKAHTGRRKMCHDSIIWFLSPHCSSHKTCVRIVSETKWVYGQHRPSRRLEMYHLESMLGRIGECH